MTADRRWMARALRLASTVAGTTWPNPGVGCVLVQDDAIIGQGVTGPRPASPGHLAPGAPAAQEHAAQEHAESAALADAQARGHDPRGATAYVTLAPCTTRSSPGATACSAALIAAGIARIVVCVDDPHQPDSAATAAAAGIAWTSGVLADTGRHLHGGFLTRQTRKRPRFTGKWAASLDGFLAVRDRCPGWLTHPEALALSRRRRRAFDAILIGGGTARSDDPSLLAARPRRRAGTGTPLRIVVARDPALAPDARLLTSLDAAPLLIVHDPATNVEALTAWGADHLALEDLHDVVRLAHTLGAWGLNDILVEGGARLHAAFLAADLYDRLEVYHGALTLGGGLPIADGPGVSHITDARPWIPESAPRLLGTTLLTHWRRG